MMAVAELQVRLFTKQSQYAVPDTPFSVASNVTCVELNALVNELLRENRTSEWHDVEFDFLLSGEFLRVSLLEHLEERVISSEGTVDIEYVERFPAPEPKDCLLHDDWVSAVQIKNKWILSGCYDNTLHIWTSKGKHKLTIPGHTGPVKALSWISLDDNRASFVSASQDQTTMIWEWNVSNNSVECIHICRGHERSVECIGVSPNAVLLATGGWDAMLKIWSASLEEQTHTDGVSSTKRFKGEHGKSQIRTPVLTLKGHKECISSALWIDSSEICTSSWDHTLRTWDAELGGIKTELVGNKPFFDADWSPLNRTLVTASADRHVRLYDPRSKEGSLIKNTFTSHTQWVQSVCWSKTDEHLFVSGSYDQDMKLWDTRSPKAPLYDMSGHEDKVLCCDWSRPDLVVSGGADNTVRIFKTKHIKVEEM
ncbi:ribosome biogenesis protein WDR12 homolog [Schistocerca americana]|uniref:ribosome biogenesis protein WDR12 homolog n=1 Tax=Schistocerca americana TaxID=7009 RepID=UPI001F4F2D95|nr:ribosome biogenesis protein WDR12 homolog [Schistocerca americana]